MCGIVGYTGPREVSKILLDGLRRLEYRGYDSAGIAVADGNAISLVKCKGRVNDLSYKLIKTPVNGFTGIGHTRWATHGEPSEINSHPHVSGSGKIYLVHNGIIENYVELRKFLQKQGFSFSSETDSEVIAHLVEFHYDGDLKKAVMRAMHELQGSYALSVLSTDHEGMLVVAKKESPLIIGLGVNENFVASDIPAFLEHTDKILVLDDWEVAVITQKRVDVFNQLGSIVEKKEIKVDWTIDAAEKGGFDHFMMKEISEIPSALNAVVSSSIVEGNVHFECLQSDQQLGSTVERVHIVACGTAYHSGLIGRCLIEKLAGIPVDVEVASEFRYRDFMVGKNDLVVVISQSGETLDTLLAMKKAQSCGCKVLAIVNVVGSTIARSADYVLYTSAGPEISVASTKAYNNQVAMLTLFASYLASMRGNIDPLTLKKFNLDLLQLSNNASVLVGNRKKIQEFASEHYNATSIFYLGRGLDYALAMEGSLKLKEISYIHSEAYAGGELKHGTIALIEKGTLCVCAVTQSHLVDKMITNMVEVRTRGALILAITQEQYKDKVGQVADCLITIPNSNDLLSATSAVIPMQLFAYYVAVMKGCDVDKPRNLAKSVTVE